MYIEKPDFLQKLQNAILTASQLTGAKLSNPVSMDYAIESKHVAFNNALIRSDYPRNDLGYRLIPIPSFDYLEKPLKAQRRFGQVVVFELNLPKLQLIRFQSGFQPPQVLVQRRASLVDLITQHEEELRSLDKLTKRPRSPEEVWAAAGYRSK